MNPALLCDDPILTAAQVAVTTYDGLNETLNVSCNYSTATPTCKVTLNKCILDQF